MVKMEEGKIYCYILTGTSELKDQLEDKGFKTDENFLLIVEPDSALDKLVKEEIRRKLK